MWVQRKSPSWRAATHPWVLRWGDAEQGVGVCGGRLWSHHHLQLVYSFWGSSPKTRPHSPSWGFMAGRGSAGREGLEGGGENPGRPPSPRAGSLLWGMNQEHSPWQPWSHDPGSHPHGPGCVGDTQKGVRSPWYQDRSLCHPTEHSEMSLCHRDRPLCHCHPAHCGVSLSLGTGACASQQQEGLWQG